MTTRHHIAKFLYKSAEACGRVGAEYRDIARVQKGEVQNYSVFVRLGPMNIVDVLLFQDAFLCLPGIKRDEENFVKDVHGNHPDTATVIIQLSSVSADAAATRALAKVRQALVAAQTLATPSISHCQIETKTTRTKTNTEAEVVSAHSHDGSAPKRAISFIKTSGQAVGKVRREYKALTKEEQGKSNNYDVLVYLRELTRPQFKQLQRALIGERAAEQVRYDLPVATPPQTATMLGQIQAGSADAATDLLLGNLRRALHETGLPILTACRAEVKINTDNGKSSK